MAIKLKNTDLKIVKGNTRIKSAMLGDKVIYGVEIQMPYMFSVQDNKATLMGLTEYGKLLSAVDIPPIYNGFPVAEIANNAFDGCTKMTSVSIPASVTKIVDNPFFHCDGIKSITVDKNNTAYRIDGNCLIETSTKKLMVGFDNSVIPTDGSVTSIGGGAFKSSTGLTSITIPSSVTSIGAYAFYDCSGLTSIDIPNTVTSIGYGAFKNCILLTSITIPKGVTSIIDETFSGCSGLTRVTIGNGVTSIGGSAFYGCSGLTGVTIPNSVTSIEQNAFELCTGLTSITIPTSVTSIGQNAFLNCIELTVVTVEAGNPTYASHQGILMNKAKTEIILVPKSIKGDIVLPNTLTIIENSAFFDYSRLTSITIPNSVTSIGARAFSGCSGLTRVTIGNGVTSIGLYAFINCVLLTSITVDTGNTKFHSAGNCLVETATKTLILGCKNSIIPTDGSVTSIGKEAFCDCSSLTSLTIPASVTSIGQNAFWNCTGLTSIVIPKSVTNIGQDAFCNCSGLTSITIPFVGENSNGRGSTKFSHLFRSVPTSLKTVVITGGTGIASYAFDGCSGLTSITLPNTVTYIDGYAFYDCSGLTSITLPSSTGRILSVAFGNCTGLTSITIPNGVSQLGVNVFHSCTNLSTINCEAESRPSNWHIEWRGYCDARVVWGYKGA